MPVVKTVTSPPEKRTPVENEAPPTAAVKFSPTRNNKAAAQQGKAADAAGIGCGLLIALAVPYFLIQQCSAPPPTPEQLQAEAAKADEDRRQGFHCLSGWDGSNSSLVSQIKRQLRDPDSFEHAETRITPEAGGKHNIIMEYRARNGFGGINVATAIGTVDHHTCEATVISGGE